MINPQAAYDLQMHDERNDEMTRCLDDLAALENELNSQLAAVFNVEDDGTRVQVLALDAAECDDGVSETTGSGMPKVRGTMTLRVTIETPDIDAESVLSWLGMLVRQVGEAMERRYRA